MGIKRQRAKKKWPKYVYETKGRIVWREYLGCINGKPTFAKEVRLCKAPATDKDIWAYYLRATEQATDTLSWLLGTYHASTQFQRLSDRSQGEYAGYRARIESKGVKGHKTFGNTPYAAIKKTTIRKYLDDYRGKNGELAPVMANRHIQYLKAAYNWAVQRYDTVRTNPCEKVTLNPEEPRTRYVSDHEYTASINIAISSGSPYIAAFMEFAVLCRARRSEIAAFTHADIGQEGLQLRRIKGSTGEVTTWTKRLEGAVSYARSLHPQAVTPISGTFLIHNKQGQSIKKNAFDSAWRRLMDKIEAQGIERFTFHDLKAKGVTDHKDHAGVSERMKKVYVRKLSKVEATE